ncbi:unnamed protein product [Phytophthora lilii]|uniref:Unnamed protein product n=1 Tax=Phytophthora lilii TaxID=2077276 RepID=A0A9W6TM24_9STRA|nr:unnamed protein product [Phytophthora lilii]
MLFGVVPACQVVQLDTILAKTLFLDSKFIDDLKIEAAGYGLSLISTALTAGALAGPTWVGVLSKLIQYLKVEIVDPVVCDEEDSATLLNDDDVVMAEDGVHAMTPSPKRKWSISSSSTSLSVDPRTTLYYTDQTTFVAKTRELWYYAVLFKAATHAFPGTLTLTPKSDVAIASEDVSNMWTLATLCFVAHADLVTLHTDREYDGKEDAVIKAYLAGACSSWFPPYVAVKRIWEREPGNKYEDQMSSEQVCLRLGTLQNVYSAYILVCTGTVPRLPVPGPRK